MRESLLVTVRLMVDSEFYTWIDWCYIFHPHGILSYTFLFIADLYFTSFLYINFNVPRCKSNLYIENNAGPTKIRVEFEYEFRRGTKAANAAKAC